MPCAKRMNFEECIGVVGVVGVDVVGVVGVVGVVVGVGEDCVHPQHPCLQTTVTQKHHPYHCPHVVFLVGVVTLRSIEAAALVHRTVVAVAGGVVVGIGPAVNSHYAHVVCRIDPHLAVLFLHRRVWARSTFVHRPVAAAAVVVAAACWRVIHPVSNTWKKKVATWVCQRHSSNLL